MNAVNVMVAIQFPALTMVRIVKVIISVTQIIAMPAVNVVDQGRLTLAGTAQQSAAPQIVQSRSMDAPTLRRVTTMGQPRTMTGAATRLCGRMTAKAHASPLWTARVSATVVLWSMTQISLKTRGLRTI